MTDSNDKKKGGKIFQGRGENGQNSCPQVSFLLPPSLAQITFYIIIKGLLALLALAPTSSSE